MHEVAPIMNAARELAGLTGGADVASVTLAIGPDVNPGVAETAWQSAVERTPLEAASVIWREGRNRLACFDCGLEYPGGELEPCPNCGGNGLTIAQAPIVAIADWQLAPTTSSTQVSSKNRQDQRP